MVNQTIPPPNRNDPNENAGRTLTLSCPFIFIMHRASLAFERSNLGTFSFLGLRYRPDVHFLLVVQELHVTGINSPYKLSFAQKPHNIPAFRSFPCNDLPLPLLLLRSIEPHIQMNQLGGSFRRL
jgi:hypothetical protein